MLVSEHQCLSHIRGKQQGCWCTITITTITITTITTTTIFL
jgi:hypothetical protein